MGGRDKQGSRLEQKEGTGGLCMVSHGTLRQLRVVSRVLC